MNSQLLEVNEEGFILKKKDLDKLLNGLRKYGEIIAPVQDGKWTRMNSVKKADEITLTGVSWFTSKKYIFPQKQTIFSYEGTEIKKYNYFPKRVLFGLRMCDLNSFFINDKLFLEQKPKNHNYENFRNNLTLVGLFCNEQQDKYCFCDSMDLKHLYDLCLFEKKDYFHVKAGSLKGEEIISKLKLKTEEHWQELPDCEMKLNTTQIRKFFDKNEIWKKGSDDCLSCGDCTTLCPTCLCFDIEDKVNLDMKGGERVANWDSCMYKHFTLVAGGHVFRNNRINRFKHRIYHKLDYFPRRFEGELMCTGCGRCIRGCPTKIDWVGLVNEMSDENEQIGDKNE